MVSRRAMVLAAIFGLAVAGAARAQGNGPGFHAAVFFDGGCSAAFNQVVSSPTPAATVGPTTAPCISGSGTAAGEAGAITLRASSLSEHHCCGTFSGSTGRARIQIDNVVIAGPAAATIPVSFNFRMRGTVASHPQFGQAGVGLYIALRGFNTSLESTSQIDMSASGFLNKNGIFAPLVLDFPSLAIDGNFVTPVANAVPNQPLRLDLELMTYSGMAGLGATHSDFFTAQSGVALPFGVPVFNLPTGYTVHIPQLNIVNNFVALPAVLADDIFIVGTNASEISLGTLSEVNGSVTIDGNQGATSIDLSQLDTVNNTVSIDNNTAATSIDLSELDTVNGSVSIDGNTAATIIDLSELDMVNGSVSIDGNTAATSIDLSQLDAVDGSVSIDNNTAATSIDLSQLQTVGGTMSVSGNGTCAAVILSGALNVTGDLTVHTCGLGALNIDSVSIGGNAVIDAVGYDSVTAKTANAATTISNARADARVTVHLSAGSHAIPTTFSLVRLGPQLLVPEPGTGPGGALTIDPIAAYQIEFAVPTLNAAARLTFDIYLAGLDTESAAALLDAVASGNATLVTRADAAGSTYQAFAVCAGAELPTADGCVQVELLDADLQPTSVTPAVVRFTGVVGHFSTWGVAVTTPTATEAFVFDGLLPPYPAPPHDQTPAFKRGRVIPLKFAWMDGTGARVDSAASAPAVTISPVNCTSLAPMSEVITPDDAGSSGGLRYDVETKTWTYNWSTRPLAAGCFTIAVRTGTSQFTLPPSSFSLALTK